MKRSLLLALLLLSTSLFAQDSTVTVFVTTQSNGGESRFPGDPGEVLTIGFEDGSGFGASYARALRGRLSGELAIFRTTSDVRISNGVASLNVGDVELTPVTAMIRAHLRPGGRFDAYAGAGAAYAMAGDLTSTEAGRVPIDNALAFVIGAGATWDFTPRAGLAFDARYLPLTLEGRVDDENVEAEMNPLLLSLGLRLRF